MQPGPAGGAQCAIHVGFPASSVCDRCGNFMCLSCSESGALTRCPSCRALTEAAGFPFDAGASLSQQFSHLFAAFQREWLMLTLGAFIFFAIVAAGGFISNIASTVINKLVGVEVDPQNPLADLTPFALNMAISQVVSTLVSIPVQAVALVGLYRVLLDALVGRKVDLARMFSQLHLAPRFILLQLSLFAVVTLPMLAVMGGAGFVALRRVGGIDLRNPDLDRLVSLELFGPLLVAGVVVIMYSLVILPLSTFALPELIVSECGPLEAVRRAWALGSGQRLRLFGYLFVSGLVVLAGFLLCCVGIVPAMSLAYLLPLSLFLALRRSSSLPPAQG